MRPTRREFFGLAAAAAALGGFAPCPGQDSRIPARFIGDAFERGHHWLTPDPEKLRVDHKHKARVVIVGGGIAGVVAAWRLLEAGIEDFVLLELEDKAGGLARNGMIGKTVVPFGGVMMAPVGPGTSPSVLRVLDAAAVDRTASRFSPTTLKVAPWDHAWSEPSRTAFAESAPSERDLKSVADLGLPISMGSSNSEFAARWCLLRFGARSSDVSAAALLEDGSRRFGARGVMALIVRAGVGSLIGPILGKIGSRFLSARVAVLVKSEASGVLVRTVNAGDAVVTDYAAEAVVLALPPFVARKITPALRERDRELLLPETTPWLVTAFQVSEWPKSFDPAVIHQCADERATMVFAVGSPPDAVIVTQRPFPATVANPARMFLRDMSPDEASDWSFREIERVFPDLRRITRSVELWRVGHGSIRPAPGFATKIAPRIREPLGRIHPCGADYTGLPSIESAIEDGVRGAEAVLTGFGKLDASWLR